VRRGAEATHHFQGRAARGALGHALAVWRHWMGDLQPNFCADADRAVLWDEAGNRVAVAPFAANPGAH
jgi:hypothetical protein